MMPTLTFVKWYTRTAVYLDDKLLRYDTDMHTSWPLFNVLGFKVETLPDIPDHRKHEFDYGEFGWWIPPQSLTVLKGQMERYQERMKRERIERLQAELAELREQ